MSVYAIRFGDWVEIRESRTEPVKKVQEVIVWTEEQKVVYKEIKDSWGTTMLPTYQKVKQKKKLKDVRYEGGDFKVAVAYSRWGYTGIKNGLPPLLDGECKKIDPPLANTLLTEERDKVLGKIVNRFVPFRGGRDDDEEYDEDNDY